VTDADTPLPNESRARTIGCALNAEPADTEPDGCDVKERLLNGPAVTFIA
jgi:hypothetical protein